MAKSNLYSSDKPAMSNVSEELTDIEVKLRTMSLCNSPLPRPITTSFVTTVKSFYHEIQNMLKERKNPYEQSSLFHHIDERLASLKRTYNAGHHQNSAKEMVFEEIIPVGSTQTLLSVTLFLLLNPASGSHTYRQKIILSISKVFLPTAVDQISSKELEIGKSIDQVREIYEILKKLEEDGAEKGYSYMPECITLEGLLKSMESTDLSQWMNQVNICQMMTQILFSIRAPEVRVVAQPVIVRMQEIRSELFKDYQMAGAAAVHMPHVFSEFSDSCSRKGRDGNP